MSYSIPKTMKAIKIHGKRAKVEDVPVPPLRPTYVLIKVDSIALNPTDWKHIAGERAGENCLSGCDFAGSVVEIGSEVSKSLKPGDRVAGVAHGGNFSNIEDGAFAEYIVAKGDLLVHIPDSLSFEKAATFPLGVSTVGQGVFQKALKLNLPTEPTKNGETVLIYGGSTATGSLGIQFAKAAGYKVITTCSPHNFDYVKSLGADAVYDYRNPDCGKEINKDTNDSLKFAWDTVSVPESAQICAEAMSSDLSGAKYGSIMPVKFPRNGLETVTTLMYTIFDEAFEKMGNSFPRSPEDFEFAKTVFNITEELLAQGKLQTHFEEVRSGGLEGALKGMQDLKANKVSGQKLVYRVRDTPADSKAEITF